MKKLTPIIFFLLYGCSLWSAEITNNEKTSIDEDTESLEDILNEKRKQKQRLRKLQDEYYELKKAISVRQREYASAYERAYKSIEEDNAPPELDRIEIKCGNVYRYLRNGLTESVTTIVEQKLAAIRGNNPEEWPKLSISVGVTEYREGFISHDKVSLVVAVSAGDLVQPCAMAINDQALDSHGAIMSDGLAMVLGSCIPKVMVNAKREIDVAKSKREQAHAMARASLSQ